MFRFFKLTAPIPLVGGVVLLQYVNENEWWWMVLGILSIAWGLAFVQGARDNA